MSVAHRKPKQPEMVRAKLIEEAAKLACAGGMKSVSIQAVAGAAGVTKGGLTHHFPNKEALVDAVFDYVLDVFDRQVAEHISKDLVTPGAFTRAYIRVCTSSTSIFIALGLSMLEDARLNRKWATWYQDQLVRFEPSESEEHLVLARLAADGLWLSSVSGFVTPGRDRLIEMLIDSTVKSQ